MDDARRAAIEHRLGQLDSFVLHRDVMYVKTSLVRNGGAWVKHCPGDGTAYNISIVWPLTENESRLQLHRVHDPARRPKRVRHALVACSFGQPYEWSFMPLHRDYVEQKWFPHATSSSAWSASILARFLAHLADVWEPCPTCHDTCSVAQFTGALTRCPHLADANHVWLH